jgi:uncharacterized membrane protein YhaH (DUF805 family)
MSFGQAIRSGFQHFFNWKGRATRAEYWWWTLFVFIVTTPFNIIYQATTVSAVAAGSEMDLFGPTYWLLMLVALALFFPGLSMLVRRLHDTNRSGGWVWFALIPIVGSIVIFVFTLLPSTPEANRFNK